MFVEQRQSAEVEINTLTHTYLNLLNDNLENPNCYQELVIVFKEVVGINEINEALLNQTYKKLTAKKFPFYNSLMLNILSLKSIDIIIYKKGLTDFEQFSGLKNFKNSFSKRVKQISNILFWIVTLGLLGFSSYIGYKLFYGSQEESQVADKILTYIGTLALPSSLGLLFAKRTVKEFLEKLINQFFGYNID